MFRSLKAVIQLLCLFGVHTECLPSDRKKIMDPIEISEFDYYQRLVMDIRRELTFDTLLVMQKNYNRDQRINLIYEMDMPKMFLSHQSNFSYKQMFNSEIMVIVILESKWDVHLLDSLALTLDHIRQARILLLAFNWKKSSEFQDSILKICKRHKMTNVILHYINSKEPLQMAYQLLNPYPDYHFEAKCHLNAKHDKFFPKHWINMQNKTLFTLPDQAQHSSILYRNAKGQLKFNGVSARLIMLFAENFNASLQLLYPVEVDRSIHYLDIINLTKQGQVQLPMSIYPGSTFEDCIRMSYPIVIGKWRIMIPCPQQLHIADVFLILVTKEPLFIIILTVVIFALMHAAIDFVAVGYVSIWNVILDEKIIRGTLGQSFLLKQHSLRALTLLYLLVFFLGLNMNVLIGANVKTLITAPPFHQGIEIVDDLRRSDRKIVFDKRLINYRNREFLESIKDSIVLSTNGSYNRQLFSMDASFGYFFTTIAWDLVNRKQIYLNQKDFCIPPELIVYDLLCYSIMLEENSPYKEPLNYLIHRVHQAGLIDAWQASAFLDMMKYKKTSLNYNSPMAAQRVLKPDDLKWIWFILIVGLSSGFIVFLAEIITKHLVISLATK